MRRLSALALCLLTGLSTAAPPDRFTAREKDWRNGAVVYQIIVDRFAPSSDLEAKRALYPAPKTLRPWSETPKPGPTWKIRSSPRTSSTSGAAT